MLEADAGCLRLAWVPNGLRMLIEVKRKSRFHPWKRDFCYVSVGDGVGCRRPLRRVRSVWSCFQPSWD